MRVKILSYGEIYKILDILGYLYLIIAKCGVEHTHIA
jgi:hypothetical protein